MTRKIKILTTALAALFAMVAVGVSAAQAASSLDVGANPAFITAVQNLTNLPTFNFKKTQAESPLTTAKCKTALLETTTSAASVTEATLEPAFSGCTLGGLTASINVNGCRYTLTNTPTAKAFNLDFTSCTKPLEIIQGTCVVTIGNQGPLGTITMASLAGPPKEVEATFAVKGITWSAGAGCPANINETTNAAFAELTGITKFRALVDTGGVEGAQTSLEAT
jgi:hypothetical protein